jgi:hypothetical protein
MSIHLFLGATDKAPGLAALKVAKESFQYQLDDSSDSWVFRYEYERERDTEDQHPPAHLHVRGSPAPEVATALTQPLPKVHFPTGRVSIPAIIRLLAEQFNVSCNRDPGVWRPVLAKVEADFQGIAHQTLSGPAT